MPKQQYRIVRGSLTSGLQKPASAWNSVACCGDGVEHELANILTSGSQVVSEVAIIGVADSCHCRSPGQTCRVKDVASTVADPVLLHEMAAKAPPCSSIT